MSVERVDTGGRGDSGKAANNLKQAVLRGGNLVQVQVSASPPPKQGHFISQQQSRHTPLSTHQSNLFKQQQQLHSQALISASSAQNSTSLSRNNLLTNNSKTVGQSNSNFSSLMQKQIGVHTKQLGQSNSRAHAVGNLGGSFEDNPRMVNHLKKAAGPQDNISKEGISVRNSLEKFENAQMHSIGLISHKSNTNQAPNSVYAEEGANSTNNFQNLVAVGNGNNNLMRQNFTSLVTEPNTHLSGAQTLNSASFSQPFNSTASKGSQRGSQPQQRQNNKSGKRDLNFVRKNLATGGELCQNVQRPSTVEMGLGLGIGVSGSTTFPISQSVSVCSALSQKSQKRLPSNFASIGSSQQNQNHHHPSSGQSHTAMYQQSDEAKMACKIQKEMQARKIRIVTSTTQGSRSSAAVRLHDPTTTSEHHQSQQTTTQTSAEQLLSVQRHQLVRQSDSSQATTSEHHQHPSQLGHNINGAQKLNKFSKIRSEKANSHRSGSNGSKARNQQTSQNNQQKQLIESVQNKILSGCSINLRSSLQSHGTVQHQSDQSPPVQHQNQSRLQTTNQTLSSSSKKKKNGLHYESSFNAQNSYCPTLKLNSSQEIHPSNTKAASRHANKGVGIRVGNLASGKQPPNATSGQASTQYTVGTLKGGNQVFLLPNQIVKANGPASLQASSRPTLQKNLLIQKGKPAKQSSIKGVLASSLAKINLKDISQSSATNNNVSSLSVGDSSSTQNGGGAILTTKTLKQHQQELKQQAELQSYIDGGTHQNKVNLVPKKAASQGLRVKKMAKQTANGKNFMTPTRSKKSKESADSKIYLGDNQKPTLAQWAVQNSKIQGAASKFRDVIFSPKGMLNQQSRSGMGGSQERTHSPARLVVSSQGGVPFQGSRLEGGSGKMNKNRSFTPSSNTSTSKSGAKGSKKSERPPQDIPGKKPQLTAQQMQSLMLDKKTYDDLMNFLVKAECKRIEHEKHGNTSSLLEKRTQSPDALSNVTLSNKDQSLLQQTTLLRQSQILNDASQKQNSTISHQQLRDGLVSPKNAPHPSAAALKSLQNNHNTKAVERVGEVMVQSTSTAKVLQKIKRHANGIQIQNPNLARQLKSGTSKVTLQSAENNRVGLGVKAVISASNFKRADQLSKDLLTKSKKQNLINQKAHLVASKTNPIVSESVHDNKAEALSQEQLHQNRLKIIQGQVQAQSKKFLQILPASNQPKAHLPMSLSRNQVINKLNTMDKVQSTGLKSGGPQGASSTGVPPLSMIPTKSIKTRSLVRTTAAQKGLKILKPQAEMPQEALKNNFMPTPSQNANQGTVATGTPKNRERTPSCQSRTGLKSQRQHSGKKSHRGPKELHLKLGQPQPVSIRERVQSAKSQNTQRNTTNQTGTTSGQAAVTGLANQNAKMSSKKSLCSGGGGSQSHRESQRYFSWQNGFKGESAPGQQQQISKTEQAHLPIPPRKGSEKAASKDKCSQKRKSNQNSQLVNKKEKKVDVLAGVKSSKRQSADGKGSLNSKRESDRERGVGLEQKSKNMKLHLNFQNLHPSQIVSLKQDGRISIDALAGSALKDMHSSNNISNDKQLRGGHYNKQNQLVEEAMTGGNFNTFGEHAPNVTIQGQKKRQNRAENPNLSTQQSQEIQMSFQNQQEQSIVSQSSGLVEDQNTQEQVPPQNSLFSGTILSNFPGTESSIRKAEKVFESQVEPLDSELQQHDSLGSDKKHMTKQFHYSGSFGVPDSPQALAIQNQPSIQNNSGIKLNISSKQIEVLPNKDKERASKVQSDSRLRKDRFQLANMSFSNDGTLENSSEGPDNGQFQSEAKDNLIYDHGPHNTIAENSAELAQTYQEYEQLIDATNSKDISKVVVSQKQISLKEKNTTDMQEQIATKINNDADYRKKLLLRVLPAFDKLDQFDQNQALDPTRLKAMEQQESLVEGLEDEMSPTRMIKVSKGAASLLRQINQSLSKGAFSQQHSEQSSPQKDQHVSPQTAIKHQLSLEENNVNEETNEQDCGAVVTTTNGEQLETQTVVENGSEGSLWCGQQQDELDENGVNSLRDSIESTEEQLQMEDELVSLTSPQHSLKTVNFAQSNSNNTSTQQFNNQLSLTTDGLLMDSSQVDPVLFSHVQSAVSEHQERKQTTAVPQIGNTIDAKRSSQQGTNSKHNRRGEQQENFQAENDDFLLEDSLFPRFGLLKVAYEKGKEVEEAKLNGLMSKSKNEEEDECANNSSNSLDHSFQTMRADEEVEMEQEESDKLFGQPITSFYGPERPQYEEMLSLMHVEPLTQGQTEEIDELLDEQAVLGIQQRSEDAQHPNQPQYN